MIDYFLFFYAFAAILIVGIISWIISLFLEDVSIVDSAWPLMFLFGATVLALDVKEYSFRTQIILALVILWSLRLFVYLTWRNWGEPEDRRYRMIRERYSPNFAIKSLYIIFLFQSFLAWIILLPIWPAITIDAVPSFSDALAIVLWLSGFFFESVSDWQLSRFKSDPANKGKVMTCGLWHYTRHPNYFGECLIWWGFYLFAVSSGAWWSIPGPLLITWLLLKFSGVVMLEETIVERRPAYREYIANTNVFFPGRPKQEV
jgi:steroid 5-alpha reductase family enzyme